MSQVMTVDAMTRQSQRAVGAAFDGGPGTIRAARNLTAAFLAQAEEQGVRIAARQTEDVCLVVSELVTNAAKYAPGPCLLDLELAEDAVRVTLWDTDASTPVPSGSDAQRVGQHGLEIVFALCRRFEVLRQADGKRVQVELPLS
jgi:two-component sensor histidine kinase